VETIADSHALVLGAGIRLSVTYRPISELKLSPDNPRKHSPVQVRRIARSMKTFGCIVPVLIDRKFKVIAGHGRILAAKQLGWIESADNNYRSSYRCAGQRIHDHR